MKEIIRAELIRHSHIDASHIEVVEPCAGEVVLEGSVPSRFDRRLAEKVARSIAGDDHVENHLSLSCTLSGNFDGKGTWTSGKHPYEQENAARLGPLGAK